MDFLDFIRESAIILIPVIYFIGIFLRQTPFIPEWSHVWIELLFACIACLLYYGWEIQSVVQGILVTGVATVYKDIVDTTFGSLKVSEKWKDRQKKKDIS